MRKRTAPATSAVSWTVKIVDALSAAGREGLPASRLGSAALRRSEAFHTALATLLKDGRIIQGLQGKRVYYFAASHPPLTAAERFQKTLLSEWNEGELWLERALVGKGVAALMRREVVDALVQAGVLLRISLREGSKKRATALALADPVNNTPSPPPAWLEIERVSRSLAALRHDRSVPFREAALHLNSPIFDIQQAVLQAIAHGMPIQLVPGEGREFDYEASAALEHRGERFYLFRFTD